MLDPAEAFAKAGTPTICRNKSFNGIYRSLARDSNVTAYCRLKPAKARPEGAFMNSFHRLTFSIMLSSYENKYKPHV